MMTDIVWVSRDSSGAINGLCANQQPGYADEQLNSADPAVTAFLTSPPPVTSVTPRQARLALLGAGLLDQVEAAVKTAGGATQITWDYATQINRNDPLIATIAIGLNLTSAQIDALFKDAAAR